MGCWVSFLRGILHCLSDGVSSIKFLSIRHSPLIGEEASFSKSCVITASNCALVRRSSCTLVERSSITSWRLGGRVFIMMSPKLSSKVINSSSKYLMIVPTLSFDDHPPHHFTALRLHLTGAHMNLYWQPPRRKQWVVNFPLRPSRTPESLIMFSSKVLKAVREIGPSPNFNCPVEDIPRKM